MKEINIRYENDPRKDNPRYNQSGFFLKLQQFEAWIYRMMDVRNEQQITMQSSYLPEVAEKELYIQPAPQIYCLYDFADEFLEEGGIEVSYKSNLIQFKKLDINNSERTKEHFEKEDQQKLSFNKNKEEKIEGSFGLLIIGWGTAILGIVKGNEIEEISRFRASQLGRYDWKRFSSEEELDWWIKREKREAYRNICRIASSEFQPRINELDQIIIGLRKLVQEDNIDLTWFNDPVREKINNIFEFEQDSEPSLKDLLVKFIESQNNDELNKKE